LKNKKTAIILGGTNPHKELIKNLRDRGYYTILIDYYENPPAKSVADVHIRESTLDKDAVLEIAKRKNAQLVIASCIDQANIIACYVGEKLNLPIPYSLEIAKLVGNKTTMKKSMMDFSIPTAKYISVKQNNSFKLNGLKFPLVIKPSDTNGSKGVKIVEDGKELQVGLEEAFNLSRNKEAIIEEFISGDEIGIDCFVGNSEAHILTMHKKRKPFLKDGSVIFSIGSISPPPLSIEQTKLIKSIANQIAKAYNLKNTPLLIQVIVNENEIKVIEFALRIGGGLNFRKIKTFVGFDIISASIDSYLNKKVIITTKELEFFYSENHIYTKPGVFGDIIGIRELIKNKVIEEFYLNKMKGSIIQEGNASKDRIGSYFVKGKSLSEIKEKIHTVMKKIKVFDNNGYKIEFAYDYTDLIL